MSAMSSSFIAFSAAPYVSSRRSALLNDALLRIALLRIAWGMAFALTVALGFLPTDVFGVGATNFVQQRNNLITSGKTANVSFTSTTTSGNLIVAFVVWNNTGSVTLSDSLGNFYVSAVGPTRWHNNRYSAQIFYARNIKGGANTVTAKFSSAVSAFGSVYINEYTGLDPIAPFDVGAATTGTSGALNSSLATSTNTPDLIFAAGVSDGTASSAGSGYSVRSTSNGDLTMDKLVFAQGTYTATASNSGGTWALLMAAFKTTTAAVDTTAPTVPSALSASSVSGSQINLTWAASTDTGSMSSQLSYGVFRNSVKVATVGAGITSWTDTGLASGTTYTYTVNAQDLAGNTSALSASATATTITAIPPSITSFAPSPSSIFAGQPTTLTWSTQNTTSLSIDHSVGIVTSALSATVRPTTTTIYTLTGSNGAGTTTAQTTVTVLPDTQAPTVPANLTPSAVSPSQIDLRWAPSTDNVAVAGYQIYRNGQGVGISTTDSYSDTGLTANTTYTYSVAAIDAAGNRSSQSSGAAETTFALTIGNFSTTFPLSEDPIFENGNWINGRTTGLDWADARTTGGLACGTESGSGRYDDSTAILTGTWGPNQTAQATVYTTNQQTGSIYEEVELRLRSAISPHSNTGYEINFRCIKGGGYVQIVRWNGPLGNFTYVTEGGNNNYQGIQTGDVISASIKGNLIIGYVNGVEVIRGTDSTYTSGNPGIGFYLEGGTSNLNSNFGFTRFSATDGSASDSQAPTIPTNLTATAISPSQIDLLWTASSDNIGVTGYQVYRNGQSVAVTSGTTYADTSAASGTAYTYAVASFDTAGNISSPSIPASGTTAAADITPPSTPTNLQSQNTASSSATITWSPSMDNLAVAGYRIFRNGVQVATTSLTSCTDTGLTALTGYVYTITAFDTSNNYSASSAQLFVTTTAASSASLPPSFVQVSHNQISSGTSATVPFGNTTRAGNTVVVYVIWSNTGSVTLTDAVGNSFVSAAAAVTWGSNYRAQVFYAVNIKGGTDTVTATFQNAVNSFGVVYVHEYAGIDPLAPVDVTVSASGNSTTMNSGDAVTTRSNDLIFSAGVSDNSVTAAGAGFTARDLAYGNITQDRTGATPGSYSAMATHNGSAWALQLIAFRAAN